MALVSDRRCLLFFGCTSSRIFENIPQNGPEYPYRNLAIATFLVTAARINIGDCCPGWSHSQAQSLNYLSMGWEGAFMSIPSGGVQKRGTCPLVLLWQSQCTRQVCQRFVMSNSCNV